MWPPICPTASFGLGARTMRRDESSLLIVAIMLMTMLSCNGQRATLLSTLMTRGQEKYLQNAQGAIIHAPKVAEPSDRRRNQALTQGGHMPAKKPAKKVAKKPAKKAAKKPAKKAKKK